MALLELLRQRQGAAMSFAELYRAGIEFPASVASELELVGAPIERQPVLTGGVSRPGVRLDPSYQPVAANQARSEDEPAPRIGRRPRERLSRARWPAVAGLVLALAAIGALTVAELAPGGAPRGRPAPARELAANRPARLPAPDVAPPRDRVSRLPAPGPAAPALAAELETQGHELLQRGRYGEAGPVLTRALAATGEQLEDCLQPVTETCLTYAYALYDLARALQLGGDPSSAIPLLQRRLQIDNQRPTVAAELELARAESEEQNARGPNSR